MAKAKPVTEAVEGAEAPAAGVEILMPPVAELAKPQVVDKADLDAMVAEATAAGKVAQVIGNAVRVDN